MMSHPVPSGPPVNLPPYKLECVIVCDQYDDFLRETLPHNKYLFDRLVVVTSYEDKATRRLCEFNHVQCVPTDALNTRKGSFCKGAGINAGLEALALDGWALHLDADMYLPPQTRILLHEAQLDPHMIYGIDRFIVDGYRAWQKFREHPVLQQEDETWIHMNAFPIGTRVMHKHVGGYVPIGFFQLWHPATSGVRRYPEGHTTAAREDTLFLDPWPRAKRGFIPEIVGYHLQSDDAKHSSNWNGRTSARFTGLAEA